MCKVVKQPLLNRNRASVSSLSPFSLSSQIEVSPISLKSLIHIPFIVEHAVRDLFEKPIERKDSTLIVLQNAVIAIKPLILNQRLLND